MPRTDYVNIWEDVGYSPEKCADLRALMREHYRPTEEELSRRFREECPVLHEALSTRSR